MILTLRLDKVLKLIPKTKMVADIGTDHAYLPISIIDTQKAEIVYAVDVNEKPLLSAQKNIKKFGYQNQIFTILSNGLEFMNGDVKTEIDYVTISGLGTQTILNILKDDNNKIKNYIICSNTNITALRKWVVDNQYRIDFEDFFEDYNVNYWLVKIAKISNSNTISQQEIKFGEKKYFADNQFYKKYLLSEIDKIDKIIENIESTKNNFQKVEDLKRQQQDIEVFLNEIK
ncbi:SAM-dependent methyltransferase [Mesoplasma syrphidae]|uniref:SAM-dependent methyltransferase n=1 Tax=Mesoplasma syrphidae TaxID=225999 RepID=A0A2K9CD82_9MOLU|nr:class I SAM-dependent methyltransferase [Mesoplasma syrphidae]AUF83614.1 SAM-dependent methyltransferase [Mesoplasma syrphidae]